MRATVTNVQSLAEAKARENAQFGVFLKQLDMDPDDLDTMVRSIAAVEWKAFDCTTCGRCCEDSGTLLGAAEQERLAGALGMSVQDFQQRYLKLLPPVEQDVDDDNNPLTHELPAPCPFLADTKCRVYDHRPTQCRRYPYLDSERIVSRTIGLIERTYTCPAVFNVVEELKAQLGFRRGGRGRW